MTKSSHIKLKYIKGDIDLSNCDLKIIEELNSLLDDFVIKMESKISDIMLPEAVLKNGIEEVLNKAIKDPDSIYVCFPFEWVDSDGRGNPLPNDPLTVYFAIELSDEFENPTFEFSLTQALLSSIDLHKNQTGKVDDPQAKKALGQMRDKLRELANKIDESIK